jgi:hypothetical protein
VLAAHRFAFGLFSLISLLVAGCTVVDEGVLTATPVPFLRRSTPSATALSGAEPPAAAAATASAAIFNEEEVRAVTSAVDAALADRNLAQVELLMLERVDLFNANELQQTLTRAEASRWLADRLGDGSHVLAVSRNEHFALLDMTTGPWVRRPPASSELLSLKLHRYDRAGRQSPYIGEWRIDGIAY